MCIRDRSGESRPHSGVERRGRYCACARQTFAFFPAHAQKSYLMEGIRMSASTLLFLNLAREWITDSLLVCFYAGFGHFILGIRQRPKRIVLACAINILSHLFSRHLVYATVFSYLITALDLFLICRILWQPRRGFAFWQSFLLCSVAMILNEIIISGIYILVYPNAGTSIDICLLYTSRCV